MILSPLDRRILTALDEIGGTLTGEINKKINGVCDGRTLRPKLLDLEKQGLIRRLDDDKPVCWCRTLAGTDALNGIVS